MPTLDDLSAIKTLDVANASGSVSMLPDQLIQAWTQTQSMTFPPDYSVAENIVIAGMGGSAYGARILKSVYDSSPKSHVPVDLANGYSLPGYANEKTLVVACSYSGGTEETRECAKTAIERGCKVIGLTSGNPLSSFLVERKKPVYTFIPTHNPSNQPRIGVGYMVMGLLSMLSKLGYITVAGDEVKSAVAHLHTKNSLWNLNIAETSNPAKQLTKKLHGKIPVIIVADFLEGAAHAIRNPIHETAKQFGLNFVVPELNHHLMEGLQFPKQAKELFTFLFITSNLYFERNQKRMTLTREVVEKNGIQTEHFSVDGETKLIQSMELLQLGGWLTFYLSMLNGINPSPVPWVDYFKAQLVK